MPLVFEKVILFVFCVCVSFVCLLCMLLPGMFGGCGVGGYAQVPLPLEEVSFFVCFCASLLFGGWVFYYFLYYELIFSLCYKRAS